MLFNHNNNLKSAVIYQIYNSIKDRSYIGQTTECKRRWEEHKNALLNPNKKLRISTNKWLKADFQKCLKSQPNDDFLIFNILEVIELSAKEEIIDKLNEKEIFWIAEFKKNKKTYNFKKGGNGFTEEIRQKISNSLIKHSVSDETREKMSRKRIGKTYEEIYGKEKAIELKEKSSIRAKTNPNIITTQFKENNHPGKEFNKGHIPWNKDLKNCFSEETRQKMSESRKGKNVGKNHHMFGKHHSVEAKEKISKANKGKPNKKKGIPSGLSGMKSATAKIYDLSQNPLISPTGEIITRIECLAEFCRKYNLNYSHLGSVLNKKRKSHKGWRLI